MQSATWIVFGEALGAWILRASALFALLALVARLLPQASAALRAGLWRAGFVAAALLPLLAAVAPPVAALPLRWPALLPGMPVSPPVSPAPATAELARGAEDGSGVSTPAGLASAPLRAELAALRADGPAVAVAPLAAGVAPPAWALVYALGALLALAPLVRGLLRATELVRRARPSAHTLQGARVLCSETAESSFVFDVGPVRRPVVVLSSADEAGPGTRMVLLHEGAHVARRDGAWFIAGRVLAALLWPSPLVWLALARLRRESERAADDSVLRAGVRGSDYAGELLRRAAPSVVLPLPAMAGRGGSTSERIEALLAPQQRRGPVGRRGAALLALGTAALAVPLASLVPAQEMPALEMPAEEMPAEETPAEPIGGQDAAPGLRRATVSVASDANPEGRVPADPSLDPSAPAVVQDAARAPRRDWTPLGDRRSVPWSRGLAALVALQDPETGAWRGDSGFKLNSTWRVTDAGVPHVGNTALAVEALVWGGQRAGTAPYGAALERGVRWLLSCQSLDGYVSAYGTRMREHGYALRALALAHAVGVPLPEGALERAAAFSLQARGAGVPGWRYTPGAEQVDILETAHQLHALEWAAVGLSCTLDVTGYAAWQATLAPTRTMALGYLGSLRVSALEAQPGRPFRGVSPNSPTSPAGPPLGAFRFMDSPGARVTANTTAAGLLAPMDDAAWRESLAAFVTLRERDDWRALGAGHFLRWDAELLARSAVFRRDIHDHPDAPLTRALWDKQVEWVLSCATPEGLWRCTEGPGDAYTTAMACILLADP